MIRQFLTISLLFILPLFSFSQIVTYSEPVKADVKNIDLQIIGKVNANLLILKNEPANYAISIYDNQMKIKEVISLDFLPEKTFNVNFIAYPNFIYLIYQYQKKKTVYCAAVKLDADAKIINQPVEIDSTDIGNRDNKIYTTINSEDKQKILIVKTQKQNAAITITTLLLDNSLHLIKNTRQNFSFNDAKYVFDNFLVDNDGDELFTISTKSSRREYFSQLSVITKPSLADTFTTNNIDLKGKYTADINVKIDNINKHYILNAFFYTEKRGNVQGIYANTWDKETGSPLSSIFINFGDSVRAAIKKSGRAKEALNDFIIKNVTAKKDGGYILMAEDCSIQQSNGNGFNHYNRWDYLYNSMYVSPFGYNPYYYNPFNPYGLNNAQVTTYYYNNIFVVSIDKNGSPDWTNIVYKIQASDNDDNTLSFATFTTGGEVHLLFNELVKRKLVLSDNSVAGNGNINKNSSIQPNKDYEFLPRFGKQVGAKQFIMPCAYRGAICFAKIEY
jgi:hypothetical protein